MSNNELLDALENRKLTYSFLSAVYLKEVTSDFLCRLKESPQGMDGILGKFITQLKDTDIEKLRIDLAAEYARLFLNMCKIPVYPFESVYTSAEGLLMQDARDEVVREYRKERLDKLAGFNEPEDHIAIEFEFMSYLCQRAIDAFKANDGKTASDYLQKQKNFFVLHLSRWIPQFCADLQKRARTDFYKGIAELTDNFIKFEEEFLGEYVEQGETVG
jgi:TorA maturation chaperone TorD